MLCFGSYISIFWLHTKMWYLRVCCAALWLLWSSLCEIRIFIASFPLLSALNQRLCQEKKEFAFQVIFYQAKINLFLIPWSLSFFITLLLIILFFFWLAPFAEKKSACMTRDFFVQPISPKFHKVCRSAAASGSSKATALENIYM